MGQIQINQVIDIRVKIISKFKHHQELNLPMPLETLLKTNLMILLLGNHRITMHHQSGPIMSLSVLDQVEPFKVEVAHLQVGHLDILKEILH